MKIVTFGNCQGGQFHNILAQLLPKDDFELRYFSNNIRTGGVKSSDEILNAIKNCDILLYQPLGDNHNELSSKNLEMICEGKKVSFPYIFNSGIYSLCHAPFVKKHESYGFIYGEEAIIKLLNAGVDIKGIIHRYKNGEINFNLESRYYNCLNEMKSREVMMDIKISDFIKNNSQSSPIRNGKLD